MSVRLRGRGSRARTDSGPRWRWNSRWRWKWLRPSPRPWRTRPALVGKAQRKADREGGARRARDRHRRPEPLGEDVHDAQPQRLRALQIQVRGQPAPVVADLQLDRLPARLEPDQHFGVVLTAREGVLDGVGDQLVDDQAGVDRAVHVEEDAPLRDLEPDGQLRIDARHPAHQLAEILAEEHPAALHRLVELL